MRCLIKFLLSSLMFRLRPPISDGWLRTGDLGWLDDAELRELIIGRDK